MLPSEDVDLPVGEGTGSSMEGQETVAAADYGTVQFRVADAMDDRGAQRVEVWRDGDYIGIVPAIEVTILMVPAQLPVMALKVFVQRVDAKSHDVKRRT